MSITGLSVHAMARSSIMGDNVHPCIQSGIDKVSIISSPDQYKPEHVQQQDSTQGRRSTHHRMLWPHWCRLDVLKELLVQRQPYWSCWKASVSQNPWEQQICLEDTPVAADIMLINYHHSNETTIMICKITSWILPHLLWCQNTNYNKCILPTLEQILLPAHVHWGYTWKTTLQGSERRRQTWPGGRFAPSSHLHPLACYMLHVDPPNARFLHHASQIRT